MTIIEKLKNPSRRQLIVAGGLATGGLLLGYAFSGPSRQTLANRAASGEGEQMMATWIKIAPDNTVTVYVPHSDMGQGVITALAMMAAEEMEADWSLVRPEQAPAETAFANGHGRFVIRPLHGRAWHASRRRRRKGHAGPRRCQPLGRTGL